MHTITAYVHTYIYVKNMTIIIKHDDGNDKFICKSGDKLRQQSSGRGDDDIGHCNKQESLYENV